MLKDSTLGFLLKQLEQQEGYRQFTYMDSRGIPTIGIGRNLKTRGITLDEARYLCTNDIHEANEQLTKWFVVYKDLNEPRKAVLINMVFNLGLDGLFTFRRMVAALNKHDYETAAKEMLDSVWHKQVGMRADMLAEQMATGIWPKTG